MDVRDIDLDLQGLKVIHKHKAAFVFQYPPGANEEAATAQAYFLNIIARQNAEMLKLLDRMIGLMEGGQSQEIQGTEYSMDTEIIEPAIASSVPEVKNEPEAETRSETDPDTEAEDDDPNKIKINSVDLEEGVVLLDTLPGLAEKSARKILENRGDKGYSSLEDLKSRSGLNHLSDSDWYEISQSIVFS